MRPGPRPNVATLAHGRGWRLVLVEPTARVLPGWRRYWPTDAVARSLLAPRGPAASIVAHALGRGAALDLLARGFAALRASNHSRRVLAVEVREPSADVRRIRRNHP